MEGPSFARFAKEQRARPPGVGRVRFQQLSFANGPYQVAGIHPPLARLFSGMPREGPSPRGNGRSDRLHCNPLGLAHRGVLPVFGCPQCTASKGGRLDL